jgi:hypothetical protein
MATITSFAWVGQAHPYDDGLTSISHKMRLYENSRAVWVLSDTQSEGTQQEIRWVPRGPDSIFEEGMLLIGLFVLQNENLRAKAKELIGSLAESVYDMNMMDIDLQPLIDLNRSINRSANYDFKLVLSILSSSSIHRDYALLANYAHWSYEVCMTLGSNYQSPFHN